MQIRNNQGQCFKEKRKRKDANEYNLLICLDKVFLFSPVLYDIMRIWQTQGERKEEEDMFLRVTSPIGNT